MDVVTAWSKEWKLELNATKSECALLQRTLERPQRKAEITADGKKIPFKAEPRFLGVTSTDN